MRRASISTLHGTRMRHYFSALTARLVRLLLVLTWKRSLSLPSPLIRIDKWPWKPFAMMKTHSSVLFLVDDLADVHRVRLSGLIYQLIIAFF